MAGSFQKEKPPARVNLFLEVYKGDAKEKVELPLRMLMVGDYKGQPDETPLSERELLNINKDNFEDVMRSMDLSAEFVVKNTIKGGDEDMKVDLDFEDLDSFSPEEVAKKVPELNKLVAMRNLLQDLRNRVVSLSQFRKELNKIVKDKDQLKKLSSELEQFVLRDKGEAEAAEDEE
ncbi:MAG: type VI secretion system contractile sheath small subunit [Bacteroidetes bacterium]|jgi:type VI secretion system protein ImpB|nr:type VI secretion system contractile sheath small subunit [Bacteroidota bacterium]